MEKLMIIYWIMAAWISTARTYVQ